MLAATKVTGNKPKQGTPWCYSENTTFHSLAAQHSAGQQTKQKESD